MTQRSPTIVRRIRAAFVEPWRFRHARRHAFGGARQIPPSA